MLDLGANVGCTAQHLVQFALMGSVVASDMLDVARLTVDLPSDASILRYVDMSILEEAQRSLPR